jgi:hypothetical protein
MLSFAAIVLAASVVAGEAKEVKIPKEALAELDYFVGTWNVIEASDQGKTIKATWHFEWAEGRPCIRCTQTWSDPKGTDVGAGIWGYNVARKQMLYVQFYASGSHAVMRYSECSGPTWKGRMTGVTDSGEATKPVEISLEKKSPILFIWRAAETVTASGEKLPAQEAHFQKVETPQQKQ